MIVWVILTLSFTIGCHTRHETWHKSHAPNGPSDDSLLTSLEPPPVDTIQPQTISHQPVNVTPFPPVAPRDSLPSLPTDLTLFAINTNSWHPQGKYYFISISEVYTIGENPKLDQLILEERPSDTTLAFLLQDSLKNAILETINSSPSDSLFLYSTYRDTFLAFPLAQLDLYAIADQYATERTSHDLGDYHLAFTVAPSHIQYHGDEFWNYWASIGTESPFQTGQRVQLAFQPIDSAQFPYHHLPAQDSLWLATYAARYPVEVYRDQNSPHDYYVIEFRAKSQSLPSARYMLILDQSTDTLLFRSAAGYSENAPFEYLSVPAKAAQGHSGYQVSGKIFKDYPPILVGFGRTYYTCPSVTLLGYPRRHIPILCDNRE